MNHNDIARHERTIKRAVRRAYLDKIEAAAAEYHAVGEGPRHTRMTFGVLPKRQDFYFAFSAYCPDGRFAFGNDPFVGTDSLTADEVWAQLGEQLATHDKGEHRDECEGDGSCDGSDRCPSAQAGSWCSSVLGSLGFEWV